MDAAAAIRAPFLAIGEAGKASGVPLRATGARTIYFFRSDLLCSCRRTKKTNRHNGRIIMNEKRKNTYLRAFIIVLAITMVLSLAN